MKDLMWSWDVIVTNFLSIIFWNMVVFVCCVNMHISFFSPAKKIYLPKKWERKGDFYRKKLKINGWKDHLPQYVGKQGFSKRHFNEPSGEYIDQFITETCRSEWNHRKCLYALVPVLVFNGIMTGLIFSFLIVITNVPYICIQRYNRLRLQQVKKRVVKSHKNARDSVSDATEIVIV